MSIRTSNQYTKFRGIDLIDDGEAARAINFPSQSTARTYGADDRTIYVEDDALKYWNGTSATTVGTAGGGTGNGSLNDAYDDGSTITVDSSAVTLAGTHATNNVMAITGSAATAGNMIDITNGGSGKDIDGTSSSWSVTKAGAAVFTTLQATSLTSATNLALNGTGTGTIAIGSTSTGAVTITPALTATASVTITGAAGSNKLTVTAGDVSVADGSVTIADDDNAASLAVANSAATTIGAVAAGGVAQISCPSLTTGALLSLSLTEGTLNGGWYVRAWDVTGSAQVWSVGEDGITTIAGAAGSNVLTLTAGDMVMSDGSLTMTDADNAATLSITNNTATTAAVFAIAGSGVFTGSSFFSVTQSGATTGTVATITTAALTEGTALSVVANGLTTGNALSLTSTGTIVTTGEMVSIAANTATTSTGLLRVSGTGLTDGWVAELTGGGANATATGGVLNLAGGAAIAGSVLKVTTSGVYAGTTGVVDINAASATTGVVVDIGAAGLTSGTALKINAVEATLTTGKYVEFYDGAANDFSVAKYGATVIAGNASGTASLTQTAGDHVLTAGNITLTNGFIKGTPQSLSGAGAVDVTHQITTVTTTGSDALTLADGVVGQTKFITMIAKVGNAVLTPTNLYGYTTITFTAIGQGVTLVFVGTKWAVVSNNGTTLA